MRYRKKILSAVSALSFALSACASSPTPNSANLKLVYNLTESETGKIACIQDIGLYEDSNLNGSLDPEEPNTKSIAVICADIAGGDYLESVRPSRTYIGKDGVPTGEIYFTFVGSSSGRIDVFQIIMFPPLVYQH